MNATTYGLDLAKNSFELYWVDAQSGRERRRTLKRCQLIDYLARLPAGRVAMEACGSAHYWARRISALGHEGLLLPARFVKRFVGIHKSDAIDAQAIWTAAQQRGAPTVAVKSPDQQAVLSLHRIRELLVKMRTAQINQLRGLLQEFGMVLPAGRERGLKALDQQAQALEQAVPGVLLHSLREQRERIRQLDAELQSLEQRIHSVARNDPNYARLIKIPGIGPLTASAFIATITDAALFKSGRQLAAFLGLVPRRSGTGGKLRLGPITRTGDAYLRRLLIHGARAVVSHSKAPSPWLAALLARRPKNVAVVARANKTVRVAWAMLVRGERYEPNHVSVRPRPMTAG